MKERLSLLRREELRTSLRKMGEKRKKETAKRQIGQYMPGKEKRKTFFLPSPYLLCIFTFMTTPNSIFEDKKI